MAEMADEGSQAALRHVGAQEGRDGGRGGTV